MRGTDTAWNRQELLTRKKENKFNQEYGQTLEERSRDAMGEIQNSAPKEQSKWIKVWISKGKKSFKWASVSPDNILSLLVSYVTQESKPSCAKPQKRDNFITLKCLQDEVTMTTDKTVKSRD